MHAFKSTVVLGVFLSAGMLMAQQASPSPSADPGIAQAAPAQPGAPAAHAPNPNRQARHLGRQLGLSPDQVAQLRPIFAARLEQMQSLREDTSLNPRQRRRKARQILQDTNAKIEAVLTDAQKQQYEQMLAERRAHHSSAPAPVPQG